MPQEESGIGTPKPRNDSARLWLEHPDPDPVRARDDAEAALLLAERCGYAWAERDALELLAAAYRRLDQPDRAASHQQRADEWRRRLKA